jgi:hypothetical protein
MFLLVSEEIKICGVPAGNSLATASLIHHPAYRFY